MPKLEGKPESSCHQVPTGEVDQILGRLRADPEGEEQGKDAADTHDKMPTELDLVPGAWCQAMKWYSLMSRNCLVSFEKVLFLLTYRPGSKEVIGILSRLESKSKVMLHLLVTNVFILTYLRRVIFFSSAYSQGCHKLGCVKMNSSEEREI